MIVYLKNLLFDLKCCENSKQLTCSSINQKILALECAIEILEKLRNEERSIRNGNIE